MPSHRDQDLSVPDVDPVETPFKRRLALAVALIALFGSVLGYAANLAGTREDEAAREAQRNATLAMSQQSAAAAEYYDHLGGFAAVAAFKQRQDIADARADLLSISGESANADHWKQAYGRLADLAPKLQNETSFQNSARVEAAKSIVKPTLARLHQQASHQVAADWGDKASAYIGGITLLAISLALLGLSATITPRIRPLFCWPAAGITLVTLFGFMVVVLKPVPHISESAMKAVAEGDRLTALGEHQKAMVAYTRAIRDTNKYAAAYQRRAAARALSETPDSLYVISVISPKARKENIADLDRAMQYGDKTLLDLVNQGANYFHLADYSKSEELTRQALSLNGDLPIPRLNLALAMSAQGRKKEAEKEFRRAIAIFEKRSPLERRELYASARTVLETLLLQQPGRLDSVRSFQGLLVESEAAALLPGTRIPAGSASVPQLGLSFDGPEIDVSMTYKDIPQNALVSKIFYFRRNPDSAWIQRHDLRTFERFNLKEDGSAQWDGLIELRCPSAGDYRVDLYVNDRRLATAQTTRQSKSGNLRAYADPFGGFTLCQPVTWKSSTNIAGRLSLESPDRAQRLTVQAVPLALPVEEGEKLSEAAIAKVGNRFQAEAIRTDRLASAVIGGASGALEKYEMKKGRTAFVWASIQSDGMLRTLVGEYRAGLDDQLIVDLLRRIKFSPRRAA
ncbi:hypothetical protein GCM10010343_35000 [Streptomyces avidinii]|nr:hypothetical protein GCM10010343_35000 [Streptomyces avidinii]